MLRNLKIMAAKVFIISHLYLSKRMSKRKTIRKLLRNPGKAKCKKCNGKMVFHQDPDNSGHLEEYFQCVSCFQTVYINRVKKVKKKKIKKEERTIDEEISTAITKVPDTNTRKPIVDEDNLIFEIVMQKIKDKFYEMGNNISYNPVKKVIMHIDKERTADDDEHKEYMKTIYDNINKYV